MVLLAGAAIVRVRPLLPETYHRDLVELISSGQRGQFSVGEGGDLPPAGFDENAASVAAALKAIIEATPRTTLLAGSLSEDSPQRSYHATYVTRSALWGFPDVTTVEVVQADAGALVSMHGRLVYGEADFGVNEARVRAWLDALKG